MATPSQSSRPHSQLERHGRPLGREGHREGASNWESRSWEHSRTEGGLGVGVKAEGLEREFVFFFLRGIMTYKMPGGHVAVHIFTRNRDRSSLLAALTAQHTTIALPPP